MLDIVHCSHPVLLNLENRKQKKKKNEPIIHLVNEFASMISGAEIRSRHRFAGTDADATACTDCICNHVTNQQTTHSSHYVISAAFIKINK